MDKTDRRQTVFEPLVLHDEKHNRLKMRDFRARLSRVEGFVCQCSDTELAALYEFAYGYHTDIEGYVVELGSKRGGSACILATGVRKSGTRFKPVITVGNYPLRHKPSEEDYPIARTIYHQSKLSLKYVCPMMFDSVEFLRFWRQPTRLIFLDTSHKYPDTLIEIESAMPVLMEGGWLLLHDYSPDFGVIPSLNEFLDNQTDYDLEVYHVRSIACIHLLRRRYGVPNR